MDIIELIRRKLFDEPDELRQETVLDVHIDVIARRTAVFSLGEL